MVGFPADEDFVGLNGVAVFFVQHRTGFQFVAVEFGFAESVAPEVVIGVVNGTEDLGFHFGTFAGGLLGSLGLDGIIDHDITVLVDNNSLAFLILDSTDVEELDRTIVTGGDDRLFVGAGCSTADVEGTHCQLSTGFTDGLCGDDTEGITGHGLTVAGKVAAVALDADAMSGIAGQSGTDQHALDAAFVDEIDHSRSEFFTGGDDETAVVVSGVTDILSGETAEDTVFERQDNFVTFDDGAGPDTAGGSAVFFAADDVLSDVHQTAGHVTGVSRFQSGVSQTLTGTVGGDEVFQHGQTFTEVGDNGPFDNVAGGLGHKTAHTGQLTDLILTAASAGVEHGVDRVDLTLAAGGFQTDKEFVCHSVGSLSPDIDNFVVAFAFGQQTVVVLVENLVDVGASLFDEFFLLLGDLEVGDGDGETGERSVTVAEVFQVVEQTDGRFMSDDLVGVGDKASEVFLLDDFIVETEGFLTFFEGTACDETGIPDFVEDAASRSGKDVFGILVTVDGIFAEVGVGDLHRIVDLDIARMHGEQHFMIITIEFGPFAVTGIASQIVAAQRDILRRRSDRLAVGRGEDVVGSKHEELGFHLGFV